MTGCLRIVIFVPLCLMVVQRKEPGDQLDKLLELFSRFTCNCEVLAVEWFEALLAAKFVLVVETLERI